MKFFSKKKKYNERALSIERYILKNKFFLIVVLFLIVFIIFSEINTNIESSKQTTTTEITETEEKNEDVDTGINISEELPHWKFYSIDLWVLIIGGTVCTVNIIREHKKAKEKLQ